MQQSTERGLVVLLLCLTAVYAIAEEITLTTYYPSPRGVYEDLRVAGTMSVGTTNPPQATLQVVAEDSAAAPVAITMNSDTNNSRLHMQRSRGTQAAPTPVVANDLIGALRFEGYANNSYALGGLIRGEVGTGAIVGGDLPARLTFHTNAAGDSQTVLERMRIGADGNVGIGTTNPTAKLTVANVPGGVANVSITVPGTNPNEQAILSFDTSAATSWRWMARGSNYVTASERNDLILFRPGGVVSALHLDAPTGNIGMGTSTPFNVVGWGGIRQRSKLWVKDTTPNGFTGIVVSGGTGAAGGGAIQFVDATDVPIADFGVSLDGGLPEIGFAARNANAAINFYTSGPTRRMRITPDGRIGVGTDTPNGPAPNGVVAGNLDANDVWLRSVGRWASQSAGTFYDRANAATIAGCSPAPCSTAAGLNSPACDVGDTAISGFCNAAGGSGVDLQDAGLNPISGTSWWCTWNRRCTSACAAQAIQSSVRCLNQ